MDPNTSVRERLLERFARSQAIHWRRALLIALGLTVVAGVGIALLDLDLTFYSIMPKNSRAAEDLADIVENFPSASTIVTVVSAQDAEDTDAVLRAADAVADAYRSGPYADRLLNVEARFDDTFLLENGLMLLPADQLRRLRVLFATTAARTSGSATASNLATLDLRQFLRMFGASAYSSFGDGTYYVNDEGDRALVFAWPTFNINDVMVYSDVIPKMENDAKAAAREHGADAGLTGLVVVGKDEMVTSQQGLETSMAAAVILILTLLVVVYRMWSVPLIAGGPLLLGVVWTAGLAGLTLGRLNIMTAMYMVALVGLGVDYAIHLLTSYRQFRDLGEDRIAAIAHGVTVSGAGIITGAITTAVAFFALIVAESSLVRELGIVAGMGILCELAAMFLLVPALLGLRAERMERRERKPTVLDKLPTTRGVVAGDSDRPPRLTAVIVIVLVAAGITTGLGYFADDVAVETNLMKMEAKGLESVELQEVMVDEFDMAPDTLSVIASDVEEAYHLTQDLSTLESVAAVDSIAHYLPPEELQEARASEIAKMRAVLQSILDQEASPLAPLARALLPLTEAPRISLDDIPEDIRTLYFDKAGNRNIVTIIPKKNPWILKHREALTEDVRSVTDRATGMVLAADQMTRIARKDGRTAAIAAIIAISLILLIDLRNITLTILTLVPLGCSFLALFGIMALTGVKFDFVNIIAVPLLIGIGIDDAVHMSHRYVHEGRGRIRRAVKLTGMAILLTTITTIIGFGSFIPSVMRAMRSTGIVLSVAMALAFLYSVILHPALLYIFRERIGLSIEPMRFGKRERRERDPG